MPMPQALLTRGPRGRHGAHAQAHVARGLRPARALARVAVACSALAQPLALSPAPSV